MKQSQRVRIFGVGFLGGCILAAGVALFRAKDEPDPPAPLLVWTVVTPIPEIPAEPESLPRGFDPFKFWRSDSGLHRWVGRDGEDRFWRISESADGLRVVRADRIRVFGNPGIEIPALEAGLEHNEFEILEFDPRETAFIVPVSPFEPNAVEEAQRLLESRQPYIQSTEPLVFQPVTN